MALKSYISKTNVSPVALSNLTGITRSANAQANSLLEGAQVLDKVNRQIYEKAATKAVTQAKEDVGSINLQKDIEGNTILPEDTGGDFTIYDQSYRETMLQKYQSQLQLDITGTLQSLAASASLTQNPPAEFKSTAGSYLKSTLENVDPSVRDAVSSYGGQRFNEYNGNIIATKARQDHKRASQANMQVIKLTIADVTTDAAALDDEDVFKNSNFMKKYDLAKDNILKRGLFIGDAQANQMLESFNRKITSVQVVSKFTKLDEAERIKVIEKLTTKENIKEINVNLGTFTDPEREALRSTLIQYSAIAKQIESIDDKNLREQMTSVSLQLLENQADPDSLAAYRSMFTGKEVKASLGFQFLSQLVRSRRSFETNERQIKNFNRGQDILSDRKSTADDKAILIENLMKELGLDTAANTAKALAAEQITPEGKLAVWTSNYNFAMKLRNAKNKNDSDKIIRLRIAEIFKDSPKEVQENFKNAFTENDIENIPSSAHQYLIEKSRIHFQNINRIERSVQQAERKTMKAETETLAASAAETNMLVINGIDEELYATLKQRRGGNPEFKKMSNRSWANYTLNQLKRANQLSGAAAVIKRNESITGKIRHYGRILGRDVSKIITDAEDGLNPNDRAKTLARIGIELKGEAEEVSRKLIAEAPYRAAFRNQGSVKPGGKNASFAQSVGAQLMQERASATGEKLDPTDPDTWVSGGYLRMGIPTFLVEMMMKARTEDPDNIKIGSEIFQRIENNEFGRLHLEAQLGARTYGDLKSISRLNNVGNMAGAVETVKALVKNEPTPAAVNAARLGEAVMVKGVVHKDKVDVEVMKIFTRTHKRLAQGEQNSWYQSTSFKSPYSEGSLERETYSSPPNAFYQAIKATFLTNLDAYKKDDLDSAMSASVKEVFGKGGWGWTKYAGRVPGVTNRGTYVLVKDSIEDNFHIKTPESNYHTDWVHKEIDNQVRSQMGKQHKGSELVFGKTLFLNPVGYNQKTNKPLYSVSIIDKENVYTTYEMQNNKGNTLIVDLSKAWQKKKEDGQEDIAAEAHSKLWDSIQKAEAFRATEKAREDYLSGKTNKLKIPRAEKVDGNAY